MAGLKLLTRLVIATMYISVCATIDTKTRSPHIINIIADDMGWNDVSFHGSNQIPTPNIDALAYNGVILKNHFVLPICTPSRTALLTGRYPIRDGMQGYPLKAGEPRGIPLETKLLPEHLRNLGYTTRLVGKWHVGYFAKDFTPTHRGFDSFFGYYSGYIKYFDHTIMQDNHTGYDIHRDTPTSSEVQYNYDYFTDVITKETEEIIASHDSSTPLYLQVGHLAPHSGEDEELLEVHNMTEVNATLGYIEDINRRKYAGMVTRLDVSVGRIVAALNRAGMLENSIIIFMADNGAQTEGQHQNYGSNYPFRGLKYTLYNGGVRGVACIYSPLITNTSRVSDELLHITDWMPTLYSAAGGDVADLGEIDGIDQWSVLKEGAGSVRDTILLNIDESTNVEGGMIGKYKLIRGALPLYGDYYGDSGMSDSYPSYNVNAILSSDAGLAIASLSQSKLSATEINRLRAEVRISCGAVTTYANCSVQCLFDMLADPCEATDISDDHPEIVQTVGHLIDEYRKNLKAQLNTDVDPNSYPEHFNGTWMPWITLETISMGAGPLSLNVREFVELLFVTVGVKLLLI